MKGIVAFPAAQEMGRELDQKAELRHWVQSKIRQKRVIEVWTPDPDAMDKLHTQGHRQACVESAVGLLLLVCL